MTLKLQSKLTNVVLMTDLTKYPPENFDDVRARTLAYMRIEDDATFRRKHSNDKKSLSVKKPEFKFKELLDPKTLDKYRTFDSIRTGIKVKTINPLNY